MLFWNKSIKKSEPNCYKHIDDLPIRIWFDIHKSTDFTLLLIDGKTESEDEKLKCFLVWEELYNQYINKFGLSDEFMSELRDEIKLANMQADLIIKKEKYLNTLIRIEEEKIKMNKTGLEKPTELETILAKMSKYYGFKLSSRELTVTEYYSYINNIIDGKASN